MTTSGKITCTVCGGIIDESCDCVVLRMNDEARRYRKVGSGRFGGPFVISEKGSVVQSPEVRRRRFTDNDIWAVSALVLFAMGVALAVLSIVSRYAP